MTYFEGWQKWMQRAKKAPNTISGYIRDVDQMLNYLFGSTEDQTQAIYEGVDSDRAYDYFDENNFGSATIGRKISAMRSFYVYLDKEKRVVKLNPFSGMVRPALPKPHSKALSEEVTLDILDTIRNGRSKRRNGIRDYAIMLIFMSVPVRKSEIQDLLLSDFKKEGVLVVQEAKGMKNRDIPCSQEMIDAINDYLKIRKDGSDYLFLSEQGTRMSAHAIDNVVHKYAKINPHALRATSATNMYRNDIPIATIKEIGGWDQGSLTFEQSYLKIDNQLKRDAVEESMNKMRNKR